MYLLSTTTLPSALLTLLLVLPASAAVSHSVCVQTRSEEFTAVASCGDKISLRHCLSHAADSILRADLEQCFQDAGCTSEQAKIEASLIVEKCDETSGANDLRRRGLEMMPTVAPAPLLRFARQETTTSSIECSSATTYTTQSCATVENVATCSDVAAETSVCKAENVCLTDAKGVSSCMLRHDYLTTDGAIVTVILAVVLAGGLGTLIFLCCRDKKRDKTLRNKKEAEQIAKQAAANATAARQPSGHTPPPGAYDGQDPFADQNRPAH